MRYTKLSTITDYEKFYFLPINENEWFKGVWMYWSEKYKYYAIIDHGLLRFNMNRRNWKKLFSKIFFLYL